MRSHGQYRIRIFEVTSRAVTIALTLTLLFALVAFVTPVAQAQYKVIHNFTNGEDGAIPSAGVTMDAAGNLYGTTEGVGVDYGTVYQLKPKNGGFVFNPLFSFNNTDGALPRARVVFGPSGQLYGTTNGGGADGAGVVFKLAPSPTVCTTSPCPWIETVLYSFTGEGDGAYPVFGDLFFYQGNIYGTTYAGGKGLGVVYELTPPNNWGTEDTLYSFSGNDGEYPVNGVIFDNQGNLYGTTPYGGRYGYGTVFQLSSVTGESLLHNFSNGSDGAYPIAGVILDPSGNNLLGASSDGGPGGGGVVFELSVSSGTLTSLHSFTGSVGGGCSFLAQGSGAGPWASLWMDPTTGNVYGTTQCDGANGFGNIFELVYSNGNYTYKDLYDFQSGNDGAYPFSNVIMDGSGNLYGTAAYGGSQGGYGVVWELTP